MDNNFSYQHLIKADYVHAELAGVATAMDVKSFYISLFNFADTNNISKLFIDVRHVQLDYESLQVLEIMKKFKLDFERFKVARLISIQGHKQFLIQQIAHSSALNIQNFEEQEPALEWLAA